MNRYEIVKRIENFAPLNLQEKWDCSGWIVESEKNIDIKRVLICLTISDNTFQQALDNNCDMIISHHPLFFVPYEYIKIPMYCAHTNMDNANGGTTDTLIKTLGLVADENRIVHKEFAVEEFLKILKKLSPNLRYINNYNVKSIKDIGFCAGSGSEFIDIADCDAFVTGDLKYHTAMDCKKVVFDIGHFESEILIKSVFQKLIENLTEVVIADEKSPFISC